MLHPKWMPVRILLFLSWCLAGKEWNDKHMQALHSPGMECASWAASPTCQSFHVQSSSRWSPGSSVSGPCHVSHCSRPGNDHRNIQGTLRARSEHCGRKRHTLGKFLEVKYIHCHSFWLILIKVLFRAWGRSIIINR